MRPRGATVPRQQHRRASDRRPGRTAAIQQHILRPIVTRLSILAPCSSRSSLCSPCIRHAACGLVTSLDRRSHTTALGNDMRRIVPSHTGGSTNESPERRLAVQHLAADPAVAAVAPAPVPIPSPRPPTRPCVRGKFLFVGDEKLYVRGVTYGAFTPDAAGNEYHDLAAVERDFAQMAANGINAVRIPHTTPPRALLDIASRHGLRVMVGLSAEQYVGYLIDRRPGAPDVEALIRSRVRVCARHPALLCYALGNEIPALMARWLGRRKVERYLERLYRIVKEEDPDGLVTYVNYPTTEYLRLPFLDFV